MGLVVGGFYFCCCFWKVFFAVVLVWFLKIIFKEGLSKEKRCKLNFLEVVLKIFDLGFLGEKLETCQNRPS